MPNRLQNKYDPFSRLREKSEALFRERPESKKDLKDDFSELIKELSDRKAALEQGELSDLPRKYAELYYEFAPWGYVTLDCGGTVERINFTAASLLAIDRSDADRRAFWRFIDPESREEYHKIERRLKETGNKQKVELKLVQKIEGRSKWVLADIVPDPDESGDIRRYRMTLADITERKGAEEALARQSELLRRLFDKIPVMLVIWDPRLEGFALNRHAESVLGWTTEDANDGDFMGKVFPDAAYRAEAASYMKSLESGWREWIVTAKNGEQVPADWANIRLFDDTMIGIGVDLRDRKRAKMAVRESEKKYRVLMENASEGVLVAQDGMLRYVNPKLLEISGFSYEEMITRPFTEFIHPDDREMVMRHHRSRVRGETVPKYTFRIVDKSGAVKWIELEGAVTTWERRPAAFGFLTDVTERKKVEEELLRRDAILAALGAASEQLWNSTPEGEGVRNMLKGLVQATGVSRAYIFENHIDEEGNLLTSQRYEWLAHGICTQSDNPDLTNFDWVAGGMVRWLRSLSKAAPIQGLVKHFPESERQVLAPQGIVSIMAVPVFVGKHWWGFIGLDDCATERTWSVAETEALKVAARAFGAYLHRKESEEKLRGNEKQLRRLASRLSVTEERERRRLARDLHDSIGQTLAIAKMKLTALLGSTNPTLDAHELYNICDFLGKALQDTRTLTFELYPPALHELGIQAALECLAERMRQTHGIKVELAFQGEPESLSEDIAAFCYRATQELLINVVKHSGAEKAKVYLACSREKITTVVEDNGKGFAPREGISRKDGRDGFGLFSIGERIHYFGGSFNVNSQLGTGTKVAFSIPVSAGDTRAERKIADDTA